jgi:hypothetical protein
MTDDECFQSFGIRLTFKMNYWVRWLGLIRTNIEIIRETSQLAKLSLLSCSNLPTPLNFFFFRQHNRIL